MNNLMIELRSLWRLWSVKLAALGGLIVAYLMSDPTLLPRVVAYVPEGWRPLASVAVGFAAFALPTIARRLPQPPKPGDGQ
ncbi:MULTISPECIES: hypothetical protein [unclassified Sphingomonas]|uniref:DUF7940 domain-containing protein n=1 Tax=Novosphingobium rhizosphaerae TaxID=1551649 RepID=UPI0015CD52F4